MANSPDTNEVDKPTKNVDEPAGMKPVLVRKISDDILTLGKTNIEKQQTILTAKAIEDLGTPIRWPSNDEDKARYRSDAYENKVDLNKVVDSGLRYFDRNQYINGPTFSNYKTDLDAENNPIDDYPAVIMQTIMDFNNGPQEWVIKEGSTSTTKTESEIPSNKSLREPMPTAPRGAYFRSGSNSSSDNDSGNDIKLSGSINVRQIIYPVGTSQRFDGMVFIREGVVIYRQNKSLAEGCSLHSTNFGPWQPVGNEILDATFDENDSAKQALKINTRYHIRRNGMQLSLPDPSLYKPGSKVIVIQYPVGPGFNVSSTVTGKVFIDQTSDDGTVTITPAVSSDTIELPDGTVPAKVYPQRYVFSVVRENIGTTAEANGWRMEYEGLDSCSNVSGMMHLLDIHTSQPTGNLIPLNFFPQAPTSDEQVQYSRVPFDGVLELVLKLKKMPSDYYNNPCIFFVAIYDETGTRGGFESAPDKSNANKLYFTKVDEGGKVTYRPVGLGGTFTPADSVEYYVPKTPEAVRWVKLGAGSTIHCGINVVRRLRVYTGDIIRFSSVNFRSEHLSAFDGTASARIYPCKHGELPFKTGISHVSGDADFDSNVGFGNKTTVEGQPAVFDTNSWGEYKKSLGVIEAEDAITDKTAEIPASLQDLHNVADYLFRIIGDYGNLQRPMSLEATSNRSYNNSTLNRAVPGIYRLTDRTDGFDDENKKYWWKNASFLEDVFDDGSETRNAVLIVLGPGAITKLNLSEQTNYFNPVQPTAGNPGGTRVTIDGITGLFTSVNTQQVSDGFVSFNAKREGTTYSEGPFDYYSVQILFFKRTSGRYALYVRYGSNTGSWTTFEDVLSVNTLNTRDYIGMMSADEKFDPNAEHEELISLMNKYPIVHCYIGGRWGVGADGKRVMWLPDINPRSNEQDRIPMGAEVTFLFEPNTFDADFDVYRTDYLADGSGLAGIMGTIPALEDLSDKTVGYRQLVLKWLRGWKVVSFTDLKRTF